MALKILKRRRLEAVQMPAVPSLTSTSLPITEVVKRLEVLLKGTATVTAPSSGNVEYQAEGILSLIRRLTVVATSSARSDYGQIKVADFAAHYQLTQFLKGTSPQLVQPGTAVGTYNFRANLSIPFEFDFSQNPRATLLRGIELSSLRLDVDWGDVNDVVKTNAGNVALSNVQLEIETSEFTDEDSKNRAYGINQFSYIEQAINAAGTRIPIDLKRGYLLRGFLIKQFTRATGGAAMTPVADGVINSVQLEVNREVRSVYGWNNLRASNKVNYNMDAVPDGYAFFDLMEEGQFDTMIDTRDSAGTRDVFLYLDAQPASGGNTNVRIYPVEIIPPSGR
jgi:hypothetical protein